MFLPFDNIFSFENEIQLKPTSKGYSLLYPTPGMTGEDISVEVFSNHLKIKGTRNEKDENHIFAKNFSYRYSLPPNVLNDQIKAECKNGLLKIDIPVERERQNKRMVKVE